MAPLTKPSEMDEKETRAIKESRGGGKVSLSAPKKAKRPGPKEILRAAAKTDFTKPDKAQEWGIRYKESMAKKPGNRILHLLAQRNWPDDAVMEDQQIKEFLNWMLERHHGLLEVKNGDQYTPLHLAIMNHNDIFVEAVLLNTRLINLGTVLPETCQYGNSLHVAIKYRLHFTELMIDKCAQFSQMFTKGRPDNDDTPLHSCMSMDLNEEDEEEDDLESDAGSYDEDDDDTQSRSYHDGEGVGDDDLQDAKSLGWVVSRDDHIPRTKSFKIPSVQESTMQSAKVVKLLIQKHDSVLSLHNKEKRTPYQERIFRLLEKAEPELKRTAQISKMDREEAARKIIANDPIASIMESLYHPGQERHIEFDLGGLPHATISEDYLDRLSKHLQFESILKYVALPKLTVELNTVVRRKRGEQRARKRGLSHLVTVFDWLRKNHVEKIVKIMVIDDVDPSHSDASIEEALRDFGVEVWDWKKLDLNTDVIWRATTAPGNKEASVVEEISLYSTGNNAVLMANSLSVLIVSQLKKVNLFIREGLEDKDRLDMYIENFKQTIRIDAGNRIEVNHILDNKDVSYASGFKSSEGSLQPENSWIDCVSNFAKLLCTAPASRNIRPVKVAIIDDGVDASLLSLDGKIAIGKSFCPYINSTDLMSPYYVPSGNHGTCMASLISKICPEVSLYVARLDERQAPGSSHRQITAKSAADAIRWATESGVDIISMSWTIETPVTGNEEMESLKAAVREAASKEILMFCSTSDQGSSTKDNCYPGDFEGCIKIGGATDTGEALAWVNANKVHFLLPGKNVPFTSNEGKIVSYESGSSVATAAASALAGLLMFSTWLLNKDDDYLQDQKNMREALKTLSSQSPENKFPRVQDYFDLYFKQLLTQDDSDAHKPKGPVPSYNLHNMEWDAKCDSALGRIMSLIKGNP
ncbi:hypothetical protein NPX13_g50 [Xylaria arbuscula]|uniref:Peptidase S8/S53 domain-containing protein n=1 Tax=Xylaria arbuscula TaxID=114810 RepID=A0A9W8NPN9_9PEZI|nr:hypothetical protein NPX13_g50 [Xylaria arbuscula]